MKTKSLFVVLAVGCLPVLSSSAFAAAKTAVKSCCNVKCTPAMSVTEFADTVATVDRLEIALGQTAQTNASLPSVKKFGAYMVKSHAEIAACLAKVAASEKIALPTKLDAKHQAIANKLASLKGAAFDKTYIPAMVEGHTQVLAMMKSFDASCKDAAFKKFAEKTTPIIAKHLACAQKVEAEMKKAGLL